MFSTLDIKFVQISTEAVFGSGQFKFVQSSDTPKPKNIYGKSKEMGNCIPHPSISFLRLGLFLLKLNYFLH